MQFSGTFLAATAPHLVKLSGEAPSQVCTSPGRPGQMLLELVFHSCESLCAFSRQKMDGQTSVCYDP